MEALILHLAFQCAVLLGIFFGALLTYAQMRGDLDRERKRAEFWLRAWRKLRERSITVPAAEVQSAPTAAGEAGLRLYVEEAPPNGAA